jgi:hypothetical protein
MTNTTTTTQYTIRFSDGRTYTDSDYSTGVLGILADLIGPDVEIGDEEQDGMMDEDERQPMRRLVWSSEEESEGDDGSHAVASIRWTE